MALEKEKNDLLKEYFCAILPEDVMTQDALGNVYLGGELLKPEEARNLQKDAEYFQTTKLWGILTNSLIDQAHKSMFDNSKDWDDMRNGKMMLYNIGVQKNILKRLSNIFPKKGTHVQSTFKGLELK